MVDLLDEILAEIDDATTRDKVVNLLTEVTCYKLESHDLKDKLVVLKVDHNLKPANMRIMCEGASKIMNTVLDGTGSRTLIIPDNLQIESTNIDQLVSKLTDGRGHIVYD